MKGVHAVRHTFQQKAAASHKEPDVSFNDFSALLDMRRYKKLCS